jgi:serine/threonine protein phosphatase 1
MTIFTRLFGAFTAPPSPHGPAGHRAYAVGDIHGRLDLLDALLAQIEADVASRRRAKNLVVFLGDLIDRGPQSAEVVERLRTWRPRDIQTAFLCGNHEEVLLRILAGERALLADWLRFGGSECLASYGLAPARLKRMSETEALAAIEAAIPAEHRDFVASFADTFRFGDYLFVHAGIRPGLGIAAQAQQDLRWIREEFLEDARDHGVTVVHGHTITPAVDERANRIGLDTGAYRTGVLTAMAVEGTKRWFLDTAEYVSPS